MFKKKLVFCNKKLELKIMYSILALQTELAVWGRLGIHKHSRTSFFHPCVLQLLQK